MVCIYHKKLGSVSMSNESLKQKTSDTSKKLKSLGIIEVVKLPIKTMGGCGSGCTQNNNNNTH